VNTTPQAMLHDAVEMPTEPAVLAGFHSDPRLQVLVRVRRELVQEAGGPERFRLIAAQLTTVH
jgi:hypothetical protein